MVWDLKIISTSNGYILEWNNECEGGDVKEMLVIEEGELDDEKQTMIRLLEFVREHFGCFNNKYDLKRIRVVKEERENCEADWKEVIEVQDGRD